MTFTKPTKRILALISLLSLPQLALADGQIVVKEEDPTAPAVEQKSGIKLTTALEAAALLKVATEAASVYYTRPGNNVDKAFPNETVTPSPLNEAKIKAITDKAEAKLKEIKPAPQGAGKIRNFVHETIQDLKRPIVLLKVDGLALDRSIQNSVAKSLDKSLVYEVEKTALEGGKLMPKTKLIELDVKKNGGMEHLTKQLKELKKRGILIPEATVQSAFKRLYHTGGKILLVGSGIAIPAIYGYDYFKLTQAKSETAYCDAGSSGDVNCSKGAPVKKEPNRSPAVVGGIVPASKSVSANDLGF